jgi:hypothetical protein
MTRRILLATAVLCTILTGVALAADISGNWEGTMQAGNDPVPLTFTFKQEGQKLTGTVLSPQNPPLPLNDGKVAGDKLTFYVQADMGGTPTKFLTEGVIKGDQITLNIRTDGGTDFGSTLLKRVK